MRIAGSVFVAVVLGGCAHTDVALDSSGTARVRSGGSVQVNASGGAAAVLAAGLIIAAAASEPGDGDTWPRFRSVAEWFSGPPAPQMDSRRSVSEQDCTRPITGSGNLKCR
jgi:hypothetical protein